MFASVSSSFIEAPPLPSNHDLSIEILLPLAYLPVRVSVAPGSSSVPDVDAEESFSLENSTVVTAVSVITIKFRLRTDLEPSFSTLVTFPPLMVNLISVATTYPLGAASSWRVYVPSGMFLMLDADLPDVQTSFVLSELDVSRVPPPVNVVLLNVMAPLSFEPVRVSVAPSISSSATFLLLMETLGSVDTASLI